MAETVLPACLASLKIDLSRDASGSSASEPINPFSNIGGARKKIRRVDISTAEGQCSCPLGLFGNECSKRKANKSAVICGCNSYVQTRFEHKQCIKLQSRPTSIVKKNIVCKSKLNFLRFQYSKNPGSQHSALMSLFDKTVNVASPTKQSEPIAEVLNDSLTTSYASDNTNRKPTCFVIQKSKLFGNCVLSGRPKDFQSLILPASADRQATVSSQSYDATSFRSMQKSKLRASRCRRREKRTPDSSEDEDENVSKVSKKLAVIGVTSSSNASCSQQARLTANAYCDENDISIDELAGYFEDFVHIPKKMSVMAEQMYI